jgi:serine/threonine-protein kinase
VFDGTTSVRRFGDYDLEEEPLAEGGMGVVYRGRRVSDGKPAAVKIMRRGPNDVAELAAFRAEPEILRALEGVPHIADMLESGEYFGSPFLAMPLYAGNLAQCLDVYSGQPEHIARLAIQVGRAVAEAHARGICHLDLKPSNILLDEKGAPFVADFGLARRRGAPGESRVSRFFGSLANMPPERAVPTRRSKGATRDTGELDDVYGLGTILYELIVGRPPLEGTDQEVLRKLLSYEPVPSPSARGVRVARDLEIICLRCLEKRPSLRYPSVSKVVDELEAFVDHKPIERLHWLSRIYRQVLRHPLLAIFASVVTVTVLAAAVVGLGAGREFERELTRQTLQTNAYAAQAAAGQILHVLRGFGDKLQSCATDPEIIARLASTDRARDHELVRPLETCAPRSTFDSVMLLGLDGRPRRRIPDLGPAYLERSFAFRDHFQGTKRLAERQSRARQKAREHGGALVVEPIYVARPHISEGDGKFKFSLGVPIFDHRVSHEPVCVGYVMATLSTRSSIESLSFSGTPGTDQLGVLVSLRDRERHEASQPLPKEFMVLIHQGLERGSRLSIDSPELRKLGRQMTAESPGNRHQFQIKSDQPLTSAEHDDPMLEYPGRWLAGYARVGQTEQVVIVQSRSSAVDRAARILTQIVRGALLLLVLGFAVLFVSVTALRRRAWM